MSDAVKRVLILGATSAIAEAAARIWASRGARLALVARNGERVEAIAADLKVRGASEVITVVLDCAVADAGAELDAIAGRLGEVDVVLVAYGVLGNQKHLEIDPQAVAELFRTNFTSAAAWCLAAARIFEEQKHGSLVVIGSVAGDRGRKSNYIYGSSKAGLGVLVQGIAHRLAHHGARAVLIKPGFVDTPMTAAVGRKGLLWAKPATIGEIIVRSAAKGGPIIYAPAFWRLVMYIIRIVPASIFHKSGL